MKAYSGDLRQRIVAAANGGMARADIVRTFRVSLSTVQRLVVRQQQNPQDDLIAHSPPGRPRTLAPHHHAALWAQLDTHPDATIEQHTQLWNTTHEMTVSQWTIGRAIRRLGWTRKKRRWLPPNATRCPGTRIALE